MDNLKNDFLSNYKSYYDKYYKNTNETERKRTVGYIYIILTLFTLSFFGLVAINPTMSTISNLGKQYDDNKSVNEELKNKIEKLKELDMQYKKVEEFFPLIYNGLPISPEVVKFTKKIQVLAQRNNLLLAQFDLGKFEMYPATKEKYYGFTFGTNLKGNALSVNNFISDLVNFDRIVDIESINVKYNTEEGGMTSVYISGKAFFAK